MSEKEAEVLVQKIVDRMKEANSIYLEKLGNSLKQLRELTPTEAHRLIQTLKYGGSYEEIVKEINRLTKLNIRDIDKIFEEYAKKDQQFYKQFYQYRNIPFIQYDDNKALKRQTQALIRVVQKELYQFTRPNVLGYTIRNKDGKLVFRGLRETYNKVLDDALLSVGQGKETFDSAMKKILTELGTSGLKTIEFKSGGHMRLDSAVNMHLQSRLIQLHNENQMMFGEEFDSDGVELSAHENPAPDHEEVQGLQFSTKTSKNQKKSEWDKLQDGEDAKEYSGSTVSLRQEGHSSYRPIGDLNCKHYIFPIILGVNEPEYSKKELKDIIKRNQEGFSYNGKHYTNYQGTQMQRNIERKIREQKDLYILARESNSEELMLKSKSKINKYMVAYRNLCEKSGLKRVSRNLQVPGYMKA